MGSKIPVPPPEFNSDSINVGEEYFYLHFYHRDVRIGKVLAVARRIVVLTRKNELETVLPGEVMGLVPEGFIEPVSRPWWQFWK